MAERLVGNRLLIYNGDCNRQRYKISVKHHLSDYKGKWLVLFFYPLDFTFVCPTEITALSEAAGQFKDWTLKFWV